MIKLHYPAPDTGGGRVLLIMLPGAGITAGQFAAHGMVDAARAQATGIDIIAVEPGLGLYLDGGIATAMHGDVIAPARAAGHERIWLLGISLGAMGALLTAAADRGGIEGLILLAPFLGTKGTIAELEISGGLAGWRAENSAATEVEQTMLRWLQAFIARGAAAPVLYLGYGEADRFAPGHRLLARHLAPAQVCTAAGGHDWHSWTALFQAVLAAGPFAARQSWARQKLDDTAPP